MTADSKKLTTGVRLRLVEADHEYVGNALCKKYVWETLFEDRFVSYHKRDTKHNPNKWVLPKLDLDVNDPLAYIVYPRFDAVFNGDLNAEGEPVLCQLSPMDSNKSFSNIFRKNVVLDCYSIASADEEGNLWELYVKGFDYSTIVRGINKAGIGLSDGAYVNVDLTGIGPRLLGVTKDTMLASKSDFSEDIHG